MTGIAETCVYTILHTDKLKAAYAKGGQATFEEGRRWVTGKRILDVARDAELRVLVLFASAEDTTDLIYYGWLDEIEVAPFGLGHNTTRFQVSGLKPFEEPLPKKTALIVASKGERIPSSHIRPYVLCRTPKSLHFAPPPALTKSSQPLTLFSWGYYGWGPYTAELIEAVDAVENLRGFNPPFFVDARIRRSVRAPGFIGGAFGKRVGLDRYVWMKDLGNLAVQRRSGPTEIRNPAAAESLLDEAVERRRRRQRIIYFCSCEFPTVLGSRCHRVDVADLVLRAARRRGLEIKVQEWPGGDAVERVLEVPNENFKKAEKAGSKSLALPKSIDLAEAATIPWGSTLRLQCDSARLDLLTGPAKRDARGWRLPLIRGAGSSSAFRKAYGFDARES